MKGLAWGPWSPVIQRCSQPRTFLQRVTSSPKRDYEACKPPPQGLRSIAPQAADWECDSSVKDMRACLRALPRCVGLKITAIHATPDDTTTARVYTEVSARQAWCFTVGKDNPAEGCWHCGTAGMSPPRPHSGRPCSSEGPRVEPDGRNAAWMWLYWEKGRRFALACAWVLNHTKEPQPGLGIYLDYGGQSSWRVGFSFRSDPGLLSWGGKKKSRQNLSGF